MTQDHILVLTTYSAAIIGKDSLSFSYLSQASTTAKELVTSVKNSLRRGGTEFAAVEFQRSYRLATWTLHIVQV